MSNKVKRLYQQFQPEHYELSIEPDADAMTFSGTVNVRGRKVGPPSQRITLHQKDLITSAVKIVKHEKTGDKEIEVTRINTQKSFDELRIHATETLYAGNYTISISFSGKITRPMNGIYPCFFKHNGKSQIIIATQFESHHAREAFPCIDEPEAKATFDLKLITPKGDVALSNTPIKTQKTIGQKTTTTFETTPRMSTYLLAFVHGPLHSVSGKSKRGIEVKSWASVAQPATHLTYANKEAIATLDFFEDYFAVPFPLKKLDQVALPDFDSLAMENWGLITFREVGLLTDPLNRSISAERLVTMVIAHELSHQWFGNLVTMKWWDDLWLNESFATIMESLAPDKLHPDWQEWEDFISGRVVSAANRDVYKDVQPVGVAVNHPDEIHSIFDPSIVYGKGGRILKMLFDFIGEEALRKGLKSYFRKYAYQNTSRDDLWVELGKASGMDIKDLMTPWIEQSGTPIISVKSDNKNLKVTQNRFLLDGEDQTIWPIPLLADSEISPKILNARSAAISSDKKLPVLNPSGSGHFIVKYDDTALQENLRRQIFERSLDSTGRIIALNDMLLQSQKGLLPLSDLLDIVNGCKEEDRDAVWSIFMQILGSAQLLTDGNIDNFTRINQFKQALSKDWYQKLGWEDAPDDDPNVKQLRATMLALSIAGENPSAIKTALAKMEKAKSVEALPAEQRSIVASTVVRFGDAKYVKKFMQEYTSSPNPDVQSAITSALCATYDTKTAKQVVKWGMENFDIIRPQDIDHWFAFLMRNQFTREIAWEWFVSNWARLVKQFGSTKKMEYFVWYASRPISTPKWQKRHKDFFEPLRKDVSMRRNIDISFAEIEARVAWRKRDETKIKAWLSKV